MPNRQDAPHGENTSADGSFCSCPSVLQPSDDHVLAGQLFLEPVYLPKGFDTLLKNFIVALDCKVLNNEYLMK